MVVVAIIAVLSQILLPVLQRGKAAALTASCISNLKQIGIGAINYANSSNGYLFPCLPSDPAIDHWINLLFVDELGECADIFACPRVQPDEGFNPWGGSGRYGNIKNASYIMNAIQSAEWGGYDGQFAPGITGWTSGSGSMPVRIDESRGGRAIVIVDIAPPLTSSSSGAMIKRFCETDHGVFDGVDGDGITDSSERKVSNRHQGGFCALYGDFHVENRINSEDDEWVAVE